MENIILRNARLIDPKNNRDEEISALYISNGIVSFTPPSADSDAAVFDLQGKWVVPGLIDMHVHLRDPGQEYKEDILTGTKAAAAGGFTAVACMPNTTPVNDSATVTSFIKQKAASGSAHVYPIGSISCKSEGKTIANYGEMKKAGVVALSDDGLPVLDSQLMRRAMEYSASYGLRVISHSEEIALSRNGCMNEGEVSTRLGLKGIPNAAEAVMVYRDIALAELTGVPIHLAHISTTQSLDLIRSAKEKGIPVTAETAPHYFTLTEEDVVDYNTNAKMSPPLRTGTDRDAVRRALADGTIDAIATDHAPHSVLEKDVEFSNAANGIIGLQTALPLALALVEEGLFSVQHLIELLSITPASLLDVPGGSLHEGAPADITVIDPDAEWIFTEEMILSKSRNSPFLGRKLKGKAILTIVSGKIMHNTTDE